MHHQPHRSSAPAFTGATPAAWLGRDRPHLGRIIAGVLGLLALAPAWARAQEGAVSRAASPEATRTAAGQGSFLALTRSGQVASAAALGAAYGGYDSARSQPMLGAFAEARLWKGIALRGEAEYSGARRAARPALALRAQVLRQQAQGVDGAISVAYRAEGFTEAEGEVEAALVLGRSFNGLTLLGNLVYGQDPEGKERDGEARLALIHQVGRWTFGLDSRLRLALSPQGARADAEPKLDLLGGPVATALVGPLALFAQAGLSLLQSTAQTHAGVTALGGLGGAF
jgi:hypothetical protein